MTVSYIHVSTKGDSIVRTFPVEWCFSYSYFLLLALHNNLSRQGGSIVNLSRQGGSIVGIHPHFVLGFLWVFFVLLGDFFWISHYLN